MKKQNRLTALFFALLCCMPLAVACGKKGGVSVDKASALEQLKLSDAKTQESKDAEAESKKQAMIEGKSTKKVETKAPETEPIETKGPVEEVPITDYTPYSAPAKVADVYDPNIENRELKVLGAGFSDNDYCVVYGECAVGTTVYIENEEGTFSVVSEGGCFAMRILSPDLSMVLDVTQKADGKQIGDTLHWEGEASLPDYGDDWGVWIGYENQGFYNKMIPDFTHTNLLSDTVLKSVTERYAERVEKLKTVGDGCEMIFVMVPASMTVYPELVPPEVATPVEGDSRFDQLANALTEAGAKVVDMRKTFSERKNDALPLYFNYDSHWTDYAAYLTYVDLYDFISDRYTDAAPKTFDEFEWKWGYYTRGDMPWYFDVDQGGLVYEYTFERIGTFDHPAVRAITRYPNKGWSLAYPTFSAEIQNGSTYNTHRENLPDIMVMRNSYGSYLYELMVDKSDKAYIMPTFSYAFNLAQIKKNDPDYLIYILSEWDFQNIIDN